MIEELQLYRQEVFALRSHKCFHQETILGYQKHERQSFKALRFLKWYGYSNNLDIQVSTSPQGEYRVNIGQNGKYYKLDGYAAKEKNGLEKDLALEFLGCAYHGNLIIFKLYLCSVFFRPSMLVQR